MQLVRAEMSARPKPDRVLQYAPQTGAEFKAAATARWEFDGPGLTLLNLAAETLDRLRAAQAVIEAEGPTYLDRFGAPRMRPETVIERDCRLAFARLYKQLGLHEEPPKPESPAEPLALAPRRRRR